ncbi:Leucyl-tRNA synthetase [Fulvivirga imtechensis AK7]|uniref:Leucine--tRNA ligase n=1 Tax=Fulvivirga imtechensis AK7 TaxID=1237149 RepID=L8JJZ2_9BACT|nr:class I tRNA ligase family protein [Fulvivirga imtechensis]ELR69226.1 Leucyl-tRNA synthetase [Fulvivirga imtechensis AK7]
MAEYPFNEIEKKWQKYWADNKIYKAAVDPSKPKFYTLDMFPYPSGAGLHVGHPLGYIASDIVSRFKKLKGYNVLHPMGFDAFGLPAEQYAIQTGQHPAITTEENIKRYKEQLKNIGFSFDWDKEVQTSDPKFYKWTQWIFMQLFDSWYNKASDKAEPVNKLIAIFEKEGNTHVHAVCDENTPLFSAGEWKGYSEKEQQQILLKYRLSYLADTTVNWCPALGTVLSNDEVKDGFSERGGHPVVKKKMMQWMMRITAYAERLLQGLEIIDWPEPLKEMQRNWIGKSIGAELDFKVVDRGVDITVFTTRIDTVFGVTYLALAPESDLVQQLVTEDQRKEVEEYVDVAKNRSERERMTDVKHVTGAFTGSYATHPFSGEKIPVWVADYVLAGYGTGAVMAVPSGDQRDYDFAKHFGLPIVNINDSANIEKSADPTKEGKIINSDFLNGLSPLEAMKRGVEELEKRGIGKGKVNYRMRDAIFTRQRYWGEPLPVYFREGMPYLMDESELPVVLPEIDKYLPTEDGAPPLGRAENWQTKEGYPIELSTMPGWAGSSWYFFRYMDAHNDKEFVSQEAQQYWESVDLYIGGSEHATGHLLYSRFWTKFLYDMGYVTVDEPFKKLINQGMIQGRSNFVYRLTLTYSMPAKSEGIDNPEIFLSKGVVDRIKKSIITKAETDIIHRLISEGLDSFNKKHNTDFVPQEINFNSISPIHVDVNIVDNDILNVEQFRNWRASYEDAIIITEPDRQYICGTEVEKMSKSKYNVVNPDDIIERYGADTLRLYEMFLGPLEQFKPWNTNGIDGVFKFLRKFWNLFHDSDDNFTVSDGEPTQEELKVLHRTIKKAQEDIERYSFNTSVSEFMICVNELSALKCNKRSILEQLVVVVSPYAPHIAEELWHKLGYDTTITQAAYPLFDETYLTENQHEYPISVNGKMRAKMSFPTDMPREDIEKQVLASDAIQKWLEGKSPKKVIVVPKKIVNVVV